jgi:hypothetical protein
MRRAAAPFAVVALAMAFGPCRAHAQEPPPRIGPFVVDVRGTVPQFNNDQQTADSRGQSLQASELPGSGLGVDVGLHFYPLRWKAVTFGIGGQVTLARAHSSEVASAGVVYSRAVTEQFVSAAPQLSFNFGSGRGWSYISGGIGASVWSIVPDGSDRLTVDDERLRTVNYGGGARWFAKRHVAFHFDVRFHQIDPGPPHFGFPGTPRTTMLVLGAGMSVK